MKITFTLIGAIVAFCINGATRAEAPVGKYQWIVKPSWSNSACKLYWFLYGGPMMVQAQNGAWLFVTTPESKCSSPRVVVGRLTGYGTVLVTTPYGAFMQDETGTRSIPVRGFTTQ